MLVLHDLIIVSSNYLLNNQKDAYHYIDINDIS